MSLTKLIDIIVDVIRMMPPMLTAVIGAGLVILGALAIKRIIF